MERTGPVVVLASVILVVSAGVVPVVGGSVSSSTESQAVAATPTSPTNNTTARLTIPDYRVTRSEFETVRVGMGSTLRAGSNSARHAHHRITIEREFESAGSIDEKRSVIDRSLIHLKDRLEELEAQERAAIRNYSDGDITGEAFVRELSRIDASAREVESTLEFLRSLAASKAITVFEGRMMGIQFVAESLQGPVRQRVTQTMAGDAPPTRVSVTASESGVVLSALIEDTYAREATDYRYRRSDAGNAVDSATDRAEELYPWAWANRDYFDITGALTDNVYRITIPHSQGELVAYMDTGSRDVYHEVQTFDADNMTVSSSVTPSEGNLRVTLERTYEGGPLAVLVEDATTGAAVNAEVTVDGYALGHTGADGHVRTIEPRERYTVNVSDNESSLSITVDPDESEG